VVRSTSLPCLKVAPLRTSATRWGALTARQRAWAASMGSPFQSRYEIAAGRTGRRCRPSTSTRPRPPHGAGRSSATALPGPAGPVYVDGVDQHVLVGRADELAALDGRLAGARAGRGGLVLVDGEPGVGKTALAHSVVGRARRAGMRAAWGACLEGEGAAAYRPWIHILRELGESSASLLDPVDPGVGVVGSRFHLFDDIVETLRAAAATRGLLLVLDDLHWADVPSVRLLQALAAAAADSRLLVVGLYRGRETFRYAELPDALHAIMRERATSLVGLGVLAPAEVAELASNALGHRPDEALLRVVQQRAEGNPLFVLELLRLLAASGTVGAPQVDSLRLPDTIREVIGRRLDRLPPATRRVLRHAAVIGRDVPPALLAALARLAPDRLSDLLDPAISADVVHLIDVHTLRFSHALVQEVLYAELPTARRRRLHLRVADAMQATGASTLSAEALAYHLRQAAPIGCADEALRVTRAAAMHARSQLAYEHAAFQYDQAFRLLPLLPCGDALRAELLLELGRCQFRAGAVEDAWRSCRAAADAGRGLGDAAAVADAAIVLQGVELVNSPMSAQIRAMCLEALTMLRTNADPVREAKVLAQLALVADPFAGESDPDVSRRAIQLAEATGDTEARFLAFLARHTDSQNVLERLSIGERAIQLGRVSGLDEYRAWGHTWRLAAFWELGRRTQIDAELAAFARVVARLREPLWTWRLTMMQATLALFEGRFDHASELADQALEIGLRGGHNAAAFLHMVFSSERALLTGIGLGEAEAAARRLVATGPFMSRTWHAYLLAGMGRLDEAAALWPATVPHLSLLPRQAPEWIITMAASARVCAALKDRATAALVYDALQPYADRQVIATAHSPGYGPAALYLGMLAALLERWDAAERYLRAALAVCKAMGGPPFEAMTHMELARVLDRHRPEDVRADDHLDTALRIARHLGMTPLQDLVLASREARRHRRSLMLTPREEQVAALVADGLSNRQIANRLGLSYRTIENHVAHILTKLGFESRARVAAWYTARQRVN
jgi:DNA-binding CsgD family transcriptional regulator